MNRIDNPTTPEQFEHFSDMDSESRVPQVNNTETGEPAHEIKKIADELELVLDIPLNMTIELGRTKMTIENLINLNPGAVIALDTWVGQPLNILINDYLIAQGEIVVVSDKYGVRITDIVTPTERMHRLTR